MAQINTQPTYFNTTIINICFDTHVHINEHNIKKINKLKSKSKHGIKVMFYIFSHQINREKNNNKSNRQQQKFSLN